MKEAIVEFFANYANIILFLHVGAAIVWIGGMIMLRFAVHPAMLHIEDVKVRIARTLEIQKNFFNLVRVMIAILLITAGIMAIGLGFKSGDPYLYKIVHIKEAIWFVMAAIFVVVYVRRNRAERAFISGDLAECKRQLSPLPSIFLPIQIILGFLALYLGGILRGF
jgi:uncharacterized membrane protein